MRSVNYKHIRVMPYTIILLAILLAASQALAQVKRQTATEPSGGWYRQNVGTDDGFRFVRFFSKTNGWLCGNRGDAYHSTNGGESWIKISPPKDTYCVYFQDDSTGYAIGTIPDGTRYTILKTTNKGQSWGDPVDYKANADDGYTDMSVNGDSICILDGIGNHEYSFDNGKTWFFGGGAVGSPQKIRFINSSIGFAVGKESEISITSNGGKSWFPIDTKIPHYYHSVFPVSANKVFVVGENEFIGMGVKIGQAWNNWSTVYASSKDILLFDIWFSDSLHGVITGAPGIIKRTNDGGKTWFDQASTFEYKKDTADLVFLRKVFALDSLNAWVIGDGGILLHTRDGGGLNSLKNQLLTDLPSQIYPQPSNGEATLKYMLPQTDKITISVSSIEGKLIKTVLASIIQIQGEHSIPIDLRTVASGQYLYSITGTTYHSQGTITIIK